MYSLGELKKQNREIDDLIAVLSVLIKEESLISNPLVCDMVSQFNEKVWMHLVFEEKSIYAELTLHPDPEIKKIAEEFHNSAKEIKKEFSAYMKLWCLVSGAERHHQAFSEQSAEIMNKVKQRVTYEAEKVFPLIEESETTYVRV
ncbi:MAG TPA: hemerythrin domain-containing protein [Gammaproteobacteria bacterium]|nr:hemerythrin domain-containing protein [Gammaproteobacteria bacterium]